jgi:epoxyqueuosine reductase
MFYMSSEDLWRWKMNVARAMGNSLDPGYVPDLKRAYKENDDSRVRTMIIWALGRIGSKKACEVLQGFLPESQGDIREEIELALKQCS